MTTPVLAIDLETINLVENTDFYEPAHWTPVAIALAYRNRKGDVEAEVLIANPGESTPVLIQRIVEWLEGPRRIPKEILTYNGSNYDIPALLKSFSGDIGKSNSSHWVSRF